MKKHWKIMKYAAAGMLLLSFFLPMSSCSYTVPLDLSVKDAPSGAAERPSETRAVVNYARKYVDFSEAGAWLNLLAFTWPIPVLFLQWRYQKRKYSFLLSGSGVLLSCLSMVVIYTWADLGRPLVGAYAGGSASLVLLVVYGVELMRFFRKTGV
jgi:hypothetical protein